MCQSDKSSCSCGHCASVHDLLVFFSNSYELPNEDLTVPAAHSHVVDSAYMVYVSSKLNVSKVGMQGLGRSSFRGAWNVVLEVSVIGIGNQAFH